MSKDLTDEMEATSFDTQSKPGWVIVTFIDGSKKEWRYDDKEFLEMRFKLVPVNME